jgi:hypothetical protein
MIRSDRDLRDRDLDYDPPSTPPRPRVVACTIDTPSMNDVINGAPNGATIAVAGTAAITSGTGTIERVEVAIGSSGFEAATASAGGWQAWTASRLVEQAGPVAIEARVFVAGAVAVQRRIVVTVVLPEKTEENQHVDTVPPSVTISSPKPGTPFVLNASNQVEIDVAGTAAGSDLAKVEVLVDGAPMPVNRTGESWTLRTPLVGTGPHTIVAAATNKAGLCMQSQLEVITTLAPVEPPVVERLMLVEKLRLSTYLGANGCGKTIKTLTLLPGEKTTIAVKSYRRSAESMSETSSILDSTTVESETEFQNQLSREQTNQRTAQESQSWNVAAQAGATWGWGSASINAGASGGSNAAREELAKNVANTVHKEAARASAKRDIEIKTTREMTGEEGEEYSSESEIQNINVSRTLNFVFRQMNQEYISLLHLVDIRIAYVCGYRSEDGGVDYTYREVTLSQLDGLLAQVIVPERRDDVRAEIIKVLKSVYDYEDTCHVMVEEVVLEDADGNPIPQGSYIRVPRRKTSTYVDPATGTEIEVPGVILAAMKNVMRTDGVMCDAILGQGDALDAYSKGLQREAVEARHLENERQRALLRKEQLAIKLVESGDAAGAKVFKDLYPAPENESLALVATAPVPNGGSVN